MNANKYFLFVLLGILSIFPRPCSAQQNQITLSTYYPAPFGAYDRLRLVPRSTPISCNLTTIGTIYFDNTGTFQICSNSPAGPTSVSPTTWIQNGNNLYASDFTNPNLSIGVGTSTPRERLHIRGLSSIPPRIELEGVLPAVELYDTSGGSAYRLTTSGNKLLFQRDNNNNGNFTALTTQMAINNGGVAIGNNYAANNTIPTNGLIVQGNVGIGITNPQRPLHINGTARLESDAGALEFIDTTAHHDDFQMVATANKLSIQSDVDSSGSWDRTVLTMQSNGFVGIGTSNPGSELEVSDVLSVTSLPVGNNINSLGFVVYPTSITSGQNYGMKLHYGGTNSVQRFYIEDASERARVELNDVNASYRSAEHHFERLPSPNGGIPNTGNAFFDGNLIVNGNSNNTPLKLGHGVCNAANEGLLQYESGSKMVQYCNGSKWVLGPHSTPPSAGSVGALPPCNGSASADLCLTTPATSWGVCPAKHYSCGFYCSTGHCSVDNTMRMICCAF